jgi:acetolactate synthase I/II/III large subunit
MMRFRHVIFAWNGLDALSGVSFPDAARSAAAYGPPAREIDRAADFARIPGLLASPGPALCEVRPDPAREFEPRLESRQLPGGTLVSPNLEDMYPIGQKV